MTTIKISDYMTGYGYHREDSFMPYARMIFRAQCTIRQKFTAFVLPLAPLAIVAVAGVVVGTDQVQAFLPGESCSVDVLLRPVLLPVLLGAATAGGAALVQEAVVWGPPKQMFLQASFRGQFLGQVPELLVVHWSRPLLPSA